LLNTFDCVPRHSLRNIGRKASRAIQAASSSPLVMH
jgi:hypothetical protein